LLSDDIIRKFVMPSVLKNHVNVHWSFCHSSSPNNSFKMQHRQDTCPCRILTNICAFHLKMKLQILYRFGHKGLSDAFPELCLRLRKIMRG
jgi:hypothetical protein